MYTKVLIPIDVSVSQDSQNLLAKAVAMSKDWGADIHVVTVVPTVGMAIVGSYFDEGFEAKSRNEAAVRLDELIGQAGLECTQHVLFGTVYDQIIGLSGKLEADLIIIGAHQPELKDYLLGSNAARIVRHSQASVLVVRSR